MKSKPKKKKDPKDNYYKKPHTQPSPKIQPNEFTKILLAHTASLLKNNLDPRRKELYELLSEMGQKGASLDLVMATLSFEDTELLLPAEAGKDEWFESQFFKAMEENGLEIMYHYSLPQDIIREYSGKSAAWGRKRRMLRGAITQIQKLKPIQLSYSPRPFVDEVNEQLKEVQRKIVVIESYLDIQEKDALFLCPFNHSQLTKWQTRKKLSKIHIMHPDPQMQKEISKRRIMLAGEFVNIGYSKKSADAIARKLLALSYPFLL